jgi:hypothetical protein
MHTTIDHDIVQTLVNAGSALPHEVRDRIVSRGARAVPTLLAVARGEVRELRSGTAGERLRSLWPWMHAVALLGDIQDPAIIEPLLEILVAVPWRDADGEPMLILSERVVAALNSMGEQVLEPALRVLAKDPDAELNLAELLARLGVRDERILPILVRCLQYEPMEGARLLADYGDPRAVAHLHEFFDRYRPVEHPGAESVLFAIETAIQRLGSDITAEQRRKYQEIEAAREQRRALAHERERQVEKERKLAQKKQRAQGKKRRNQQKASRKKNR